MTDSYGLPTGAAINYGAQGFPPWVYDLASRFNLKASTYPGHQESERPDIHAAPNPQHLNRGIDWAGDPQHMLDFAHWLRDTAPPGLEMVIYQDPRTGEQVWYPTWVNFADDLPNHQDHVHSRNSQAIAVEAQPKVVTVPLVHNADGTWTSPSPAWAHLIMRESGGNPTIIQQITDVNSGGNEAEGLFQITPATWRAHQGSEFAPSARSATPQQQALVAARIFTRNPSGSDWGAGLAGREDANQLAAGLISATTPAPPVEDTDFMSALSPDEQRALYNEIMGPRPSRSPLRHVGEGNVGDVEDLMLNTDGATHTLLVYLLGVILGDPDAIALLREVASINPARYPDRVHDARVAQAMLNVIDGKVTVESAAPTGQTPGVVPTPQPVIPPTPVLPNPIPAPAPVQPLPVPLPAVIDPADTGEVIAALYRALDHLRLADAMPIDARAPMQALISVLQTKNGVPL